MIDKGLIQEFLNIRDTIIEKRYRYLSEEQRKAVFSNEKYILLVACPGAGKTKTLISRIDYLTTYGPVYKSEVHGIVTREKIKQLYCASKDEHYGNSRLLSEFAVNPNNIHVLTFTKAAAMEMKKRYKLICNTTNTPFFGTFHSLFYRILKYQYPSINIIQEEEQLNIVKKILKNYIGETSEEKGKAVNSAISFYNACGKFSIDEEILKYCLNEYNYYKNKKNIMDFDDLQIKCVDILKNNNELLKGYKRKFEYILVDEFQDSAKKEMEFLNLFKDSSSIFAVGDEDQNIYCFRGATPEYMMNFKKEFNNAKILFLSKNYRSKKDIVLKSSTLIRFNNGRNEKDICANRNGNKSMKINYFIDECEQDAYISQVVKDDVENFSNTTAVLYRTNKEAELVMNNFIINDIPFFFLNKEFETYNSPICRDIMCYMRLAADNKDIKSFIEISNKPNRGISKEVLAEITENIPDDSWFNILRNSSRISITALRKASYLNVLLFILNILKLNKKIKYIRKMLGYDKYLMEYCKFHGENMENVIQIIEKFNNYICESNIEEKIAQKNFKEDAIKKGILLSTIHGVKGMEFDNVFIINCCEGTIPYEKSSEIEIEEERRLFYVGVTRAKNKIWILVPRKISGVTTIESRFIKEMSGYVE